MSVVGERLNALFAAFLQDPSPLCKRPAEWSNGDLAKAAAEASGSADGKQAVTPQYISQLRRGAKTDPGLRVSRAIAGGFAVLSRRGGTPYPTFAILRYLAGEFPGADQPAGPEQALGMLDQLSGSESEDPVAVLARDGDAMSLTAIDALLSRLERPDAASLRERFANLIHRRARPEEQRGDRDTS